MTLGTTDFDEYLLPRFKRAADGTVFTSAAKQGLAMFRMRRASSIYPDVITSYKHPNKSYFCKRVSSMYKLGKTIRALRIYQMLVAHGVYRPGGTDIFGPVVHKVSVAVIKNKYLHVDPPDAQDSTASAGSAHDPAVRDGVTWEEVGQCMAVLESWGDNQGNAEEFTGTMSTFFALHYKPSQAHFVEIWGSYSVICPMKIMAKENEFSGHKAYNSLENEPVEHYALLYQPIDEVRCQRSPRTCSCLCSRQSLTAASLLRYEIISAKRLACISLGLAYTHKH